MVFRRPLATAVVVGGAAHMASNRTANQIYSQQRSQQVDATMNETQVRLQDAEVKIMQLEQKIAMQDNRIAVLERQIEKLMALK